MCGVESGISWRCRVHQNTVKSETGLGENTAYDSYELVHSNILFIGQAMDLKKICGSQAVTWKKMKPSTSISRMVLYLNFFHFNIACSSFFPIGFLTQLCTDLPYFNLGYFPPFLSIPFFFISSSLMDQIFVGWGGC